MIISKLGNLNCSCFSLLKALSLKSFWCNKDIFVCFFFIFSRVLFLFILILEQQSGMLINVVHETQILNSLALETYCPAFSNFRIGYIGITMSIYWCVYGFYCGERVYICWKWFRDPFLDLIQDIYVYNRNCMWVNI